MKIQDIIKQRIMILDGALGTMIQDYNLEEKDFRNADLAHHEGQPDRDERVQGGGMVLRNQRDAAAPGAPSGRQTQEVDATCPDRLVGARVRVAACVGGVGLNGQGAGNLQGGREGTRERGAGEGLAGPGGAEQGGPA